MFWDKRPLDLIDMEVRLLSIFVTLKIVRMVSFGCS